MGRFYLAAIIPGLLLSFGLEGSAGALNWTVKAFDSWPLTLSILASSPGILLTLAFCLSTYRNLISYSVECPLLSGTCGEGSPVMRPPMENPSEEIFESLVEQITGGPGSIAEDFFARDLVEPILRSMPMPGGGRWGFRVRKGVFGRSPLEWERLWDLEAISCETDPDSCGLVESRPEKASGSMVAEILFPAFEGGWGDCEVRYLLGPAQDGTLVKWRHDRNFAAIGRYLASRDQPADARAVEPSGTIQPWAPWGDPLTGLDWNEGPLPYCIPRATPMGMAFTGTFNFRLARNPSPRCGRIKAMRAWVASVVFGPPLAIVSSLSLYGASTIPLNGPGPSSILYEAGLFSAAVGFAVSAAVCAVSWRFAGKPPNPP